ncbi:TonB-dependent receptor [Dysgonomonas sp. HDW5B]|uniref:TonB-dependent receptor n=1 Tax=Dysgonomonas sp. HDW5B TaxID=2714927 RepID=UPI001408370E|nr:TonB-dependent receptor [Dysgonomonas sp. HDW5B]QIK54946.1 TonB-dependent receptor [Dysgonomonas sp. HDW5B]
MRKKLLLTALACCIVSVALAQMTLQGKVVDEDGQPVLCATVRLEKTTIGAVTNGKGEFVFKDVPNGEYVMRTSRMDFETQKHDVSRTDNNLLIRLKKSYLNLNEVVVTGTGTYHRLKDTPVPVEVITAKEIANTGALNFEDALSALSTSITTKGAYNIVMNGLRNKQVLILVDGKRLAGDVGGDNDLERIDMSNIKRIEVVKGGASSLYGSEAMGGVINIITNTPQNSMDIVSATRISKYGQFNQNANVGFKVGKFISQTTYQRRQTEGWQLSPYEIKSLSKPTRDTLVATGKQAMAAYHSNTVSQKFVYNPTKKSSVYTKGVYFDKKTDRPYADYAYDMFYKDYNFALGGDYHFRKHINYITFDSYFDNYEYYKDYLKKSGKFEAGDRDLTKRQRLFNTTVKGVFSLGENHKLNTGLDFMNEYMKNPESLAESKSAYTMAFYAQDEIKVIERLSVVAGFRLLHHETFKNKFTPKASAMYALDHFNFRASYAMGFRAPNLQELYYDKISGSMVSQGNINLKPERSNYFSLNTEYISDHFTFSITGYINNIKDIIDRQVQPLTPEDEAGGIKTRYMYNNVSKARTQGVDIAINTFLGDGFSIGINYSYLDARNRIDNKPLFGSSRHTGILNGNWMKEWKNYRLNVNLNSRLQSETYYTDMNARPFQLWNLATSHAFTGAKNLIFEPGFGIENIFNFRDEKPFGSKYATTSLGRTVFASLTLKFKK